MAAGEVELRAEVGAGGGGNNDGQPSRVRLFGTIWHQYRTIIAPGGQSGSGNEGGVGYSGGGGFGGSSGGVGGSNGNDGGQGSSYAGGSGTWEDITAYQLSEFTLSPGQGGQPYRHSSSSYYGGGGGGVLVGGSGPSRDNQYQGEGYGGGGGGWYDGSRLHQDGLPGVILVEVV